MKSVDKCNFIIFRQFCFKIMHPLVLDCNIRSQAANHRTQIYKIIHSVTRFAPHGVIIRLGSGTYKGSVHVAFRK